MPLGSRRSRLFVPLIGLAAVSASVAVPASQAAAAPRAASAASVVSDAGSVWSAVDEPLRRSHDGDKRRVDPSSYAGYHLDLGALETRLDRAPDEAARGAAPVTIKVPSPDGDLVEFAIEESPVMEEGLALQHPEIKTYAGRTAGDDDIASIRLDVTAMGFHASVRGDGASWYVDPAYNGTDQGADALYLSYRGDDLPEPQRQLVEPSMKDLDPHRTAQRVDRRIGEGGGAVAIQRTYRLALVTDPSYTAYFTNSTDPAVVNPIVTGEKVTLMNRVNQVYGDDASIRMILVANNDKLNFNTATQFTGANGACGNVACYTSADIGCGDVIDTNRFVVGQIIGAENYDIGHIMFGPDGDGGGVAYLGAVGTDIKAGGCTGLNPPTGDGFAIDYVAHEMGHQFAGNHTFNGNTGSCAGGNRNNGTAVEPGSGVSVMAYAGICGIDNLQNHSDPYFSQRSQQEIAAFTRSTPGNLREIQNIALSGFTTSGESFSISYGGTAQTVTVGTNYTAAGLKTALEAAEPSSATATVTGSKGTTFGTGVNGFQVTWSGTADIPTPTVTLVSGSFTSIVGTYDNGGPETMGGFNNPTPTGNHNPTVTAPAGKTIPIRTPFALTGSATDPDGDALTYLWEQNDAGAGSVLSSNTKLVGPLFRIFGTYANVTAAGTQQYHSPGLNLATNNPTRSFPDAAQVAAGETNAATGTCPTLTGTGTADTPALRCMSEFLPTTARTMNFRLTARDLGGADGGSDGGTSFADTAITVGLAGPFAVSSNAGASSVTGNTTGTVTWNVAGTNTATYATNVKISFSTDGGLTFPTVLAASTPNDGTESITWPNVSTTQGRFKVEAVDNYFYDVNKGNITVTPGSTGGALTLGGNATTTSSFTGVHSDPLATTPTITASSTSANGSAITATPTGLPAGLALTRGATSADGTNPGTTSFSVTGNVTADPGTYPVQVSVSDGVNPPQVVSFSIVVGKDAATVTYTGDTTATAAATGTTPVTLSATVEDDDATPGTVDGTVTFTDSATSTTLCTAPVTAGAASCDYQAAAETRTYQVVSTLSSTRYQGSAAATPVVVTVDEGDTTPPQTTIGAKPSQGSFVLDDQFLITYSSSEADSTFTCAFGASTFDCPADGVPFSKPKAGSYEFTVAATDAAGNTDVTPAARRFSVPVNDKQLKVAKGPWKRASVSGAYRGSASKVARKGATLTYSVKRVTSLALVVTKAPGAGSVDVFLGSKKLRTIRLNGSAKKRALAAIATFGTPASGTVRIVTTNGKPVSIEGLGVRTSYAPAGRSFARGLI